MNNTFVDFIKSCILSFMFGTNGLMELFRRVKDIVMELLEEPQDI